MSELRDYQRLLIDNIIEDFAESMSIDEVESRLESRIEAYDRERWEQIERDLPGAMLRAVESIKC